MPAGNVVFVLCCVVAQECFFCFFLFCSVLFLLRLHDNTFCSHSEHVLYICGVFLHTCFSHFESSYVKKNAFCTVCGNASYVGCSVMT